jgi:hypothetical protein
MRSLWWQFFPQNERVIARIALRVCMPHVLPTSHCARKIRVSTHRLARFSPHVQTRTTRVVMVRSTWFICCGVLVVCPPHRVLLCDRTRIICTRIYTRIWMYTTWSSWWWWEQKRLGYTRIFVAVNRRIICARKETLVPVLLFYRYCVGIIRTVLSVLAEILSRLTTSVYTLMIAIKYWVIMRDFTIVIVLEKKNIIFLIFFIRIVTKWSS